MEKFSRFTDARTGVNPFTVPVHSGSTVENTLALLYAIIRLPFVLLVAGPLFLADNLAIRVS